jgi:hypothetical protein
MGLLLPLFSGAGVRETVHNLSVSGPGNVKSVNAAAVCDFCHISHSPVNNNGLWNRERSQAVYIPYSSSTAVANPGQPTGTSVMCLSCHDGTICA